MPSTGLIGPNVDAYGAAARAGALADYVECRALSESRLTPADLQDIAEEQNWSRKSRRVILVDNDDPEADPAAWSEQAFAEIATRADILGRDYPFELQRGALSYSGPADPRDNVYVGLLALTVVHAWQLTCAVDPKVVLEAIVRDVLATQLNVAVSMGTGDRQGLPFEQNLHSQATLCGLAPMPEPRPVRAAAKDAGVDTLGVIRWHDRRSGQWVFIGQVTCAASSEWKKKLRQAEPETWRHYLQEALLPRSFLAVPHHIDQRQWAELMVTRDGLLLDRLRLCLKKAVNSADDRTLVSTLLEADQE